MKIIAIPLTVLHLLIFFVILLVFHPLQWLCLKLGGYQAHKFSVEVLNWFLLKSVLPLGIIFTFDNKHKLEKGKSYIIVANHQSMFDIPPIIWYLRKVHPKFISKKELGKGIPSVSYNLRHSGAALIDRKDPRQALTEITRFAKAMHHNKRSAVIFPEGTRSRNGTMKSFSYNGLKVLFKQMPEASVLPVAISNSWKIQRYGKFPLGIGIKVKLKVLDPIDVPQENQEAFIDQLQKNIAENVK